MNAGNDMSDELWSWSARRLAAAIRAGDVSAAEVTASSLQRVQAVNPALNTIVDVLMNEAMAEAHAADDTRRLGEALGPLHGVPAAVKVNFDLCGRPLAKSKSPKQSIKHLLCLPASKVC